MATSRSFRRAAAASACVALAASVPGGAEAQGTGVSPASPAASGVAAVAPSEPSAELQTVTVTAPALPRTGVAGWGDIPLARTPVQARLITAAQLRDSGLQRLADLTRVDPAVSDAYNAEGYVDALTIRGYVLDNRFNFLRDGLPINAETSIPLDNKAQIEILKGTSGLQSGTSAPGGLVNHVVKRPLDAPLRSAFVEWRQPGTWTASADLSQRFGPADSFGVRLNAAGAHLDPMVRDSVGHRSLFALAADWRVSPDTLLEAEVETSRRVQPSQAAFSLLGDSVPAPDNPRLNLNNQSWSQPVAFGATTGSLRWQQKLAEGWRFVAHAMAQRLTTDDRLAFPFGLDCNNGSTFTGTYYCDRYGPNGTFDLYDFRSEGERRRTEALDLALHGELRTGPLRHALSFGLRRTHVRNRFHDEAYNFVGVGNVDGTAVLPPDPTPSDTNTNRDERNVEGSIRDAVALTDRLSVWLGVRHTQLHRASVRTDGSQPSDYRGSFNAPFAALSHEVLAGHFLYASWGRGVESNVVANRSRYTNAGATFTSPSRQVEVGWKGSVEHLAWALAAFDIHRPRLQDFGSCDGPATCTTQPDGNDHHRGVEASGSWNAGRWQLAGGLQWLHARVDGSADPTVDGREPPNVPARTAKLRAAYTFTPDLVGALAGVAESHRMALPDDSIAIGGYARLDGDVRWSTRVAGTAVVWRAGVDNLLDRRAWREAPYQYGHAYLYPLLPRTWRLSAQIDL